MPDVSPAAHAVDASERHSGLDRGALAHDLNDRGLKPELKPVLKPVLNDDMKEQALLRALATWPSLIVAYSGGVDSAYLAWAATRVLGRRALCITADSPSYPDRHRDACAPDRR